MSLIIYTALTIIQILLIVSVIVTGFIFAASLIEGRYKLFAMLVFSSFYESIPYMEGLKSGRPFVLGDIVVSIIILAVLLYLFLLIGQRKNSSDNNSLGLSYGSENGYGPYDY